MVLAELRGHEEVMRNLTHEVRARCAVPCQSQRSSGWDVLTLARAARHSACPERFASFMAPNELDVGTQACSQVLLGSVQSPAEVKTDKAAQCSISKKFCFT